MSRKLRDSSIIIRFFHELDNLYQTILISILKITTAIILILFSIAANAATKTWIGDVDADWSDPNNWSGNSLPNNDDIIIIDADNYTTAPIMTANSPFTIDDLTIRDGGIFTKTGGSLTVNDDIIVDGGTFTNSGGSINLDEVRASNNANINLTSGTVTIDGDLDGDSGATFNISTIVTQTGGDEDLEVGTNVTFNISAGAVITGFDDVDFDTGGGSGTFNMTGGSLSIGDDFKIQDGDDNTVTISGGSLDVGDDFEMETDNNQITFNGTADIDFGGQFEFGANGGGAGNDATNSTVTVGGTATLDVVGDINFYDGGDDGNSYLNVESGATVTAADIDDPDNSVNIEVGGSVTSGGTPLPVELLEFQGLYQSGAIKLSWITASELNNDYFEVQRSNDGINFYPLGIVEGGGDSKQKLNYNFIDYSPIIESQYYRLLQVDYDGGFEYLTVIFVEASNLTNIDISIYPNPSSNGNVNIQNLGFIVEGNTHIKIINSFGALVYSETTDAFQHKSIPGLSNLSSGIYTVIINNNGRVIHKRVVLNH